MATIYTIDNTTTAGKTDLIELGQADKERTITVENFLKSALPEYLRGVPEDFDYSKGENILVGEGNVTINIQQINKKNFTAMIGGTTGDYSLIIELVDGFYFLQAFFYMLSLDYHTSQVLFSQGGSFFEYNQFQTSGTAKIILSLSGWYQVKNGIIFKL